jgi:hypothetical protein
VKIYLLSQTVNNDWDTFDSCVVFADDEESAAAISPSAHLCEWAPAEKVSVEYLGDAREGAQAGTVVCASFNAG